MIIAPSWCGVVEDNGGWHIVCAAVSVVRHAVRLTAFEPPGSPPAPGYVFQE